MSAAEEVVAVVGRVAERMGMTTEAEFVGAAGGREPEPPVTEDDPLADHEAPEEPYA